MDTILSQQSKVPRWLHISFVVLSLIGFIDATYLTVVHYSGAELVCGPFAGCATVTTSTYSTIGPLPVALLGAVYYVSILLLSVAYLDSKKLILARARAYVTVIGVCASIFFVYLQLVVIRQICTYCMVSAGTSTLLFLLGIYSLIKTKPPHVAVDS